MNRATEDVRHSMMRLSRVVLNTGAQSKNGKFMGRIAPAKHLQKRVEAMCSCRLRAPGYAGWPETTNPRPSWWRYHPGLTQHYSAICTTP